MSRIRRPALALCGLLLGVALLTSGCSSRNTHHHHNPDGSYSYYRFNHDHTSSCNCRSVYQPSSHYYHAHY